MFSEKLNFLMEITKVQNNMLAAAVNVDASHISRLRHGNRNLPKNQTYLMPIARYFSRQIKVDYQKKIISDAIGIKNELPGDSEKLAKLLYDWLSDHTSGSDASVGSIIQSFSGIGQNKTETASFETEEYVGNNRYYYGKCGKREAVIRFLTQVANEEIPQTLLLFSDEEMSWLYEDNAFAKKWAILLKNVLVKGNRIQIIHTVSRDLNELLEAVAKWIPIYATGAIEPYYYPKLRDGLFQRTLFIAPQTAAVISNSVQQKTDGMLNSYIDDKEAVAALSEDFNNYLSLCRPLMRIYNILNADKFKKLYIDFIEAEGDFISLRTNLSLPTMPKELIDEIVDDDLSELYLNICKSYADTLKCYTFTEILTIPKAEDSSIHPEILGIGSIKLTKKQHVAHINNMISLLKANENYDVVLSDTPIQNIIVLAKENVGVMMINTKPPYCTFAFNEQNMVGAFWDYLSSIKKKTHSRSKTIEDLEKFISFAD